LIDIWCFNATFNNISAISWRTVLVVEEAGVPGENHRPRASNDTTDTQKSASYLDLLLEIDNGGRFKNKTTKNAMT
jgi:hypothetical protein